MWMDHNTARIVTPRDAYYFRHAIRVSCQTCAHMQKNCRFSLKKNDVRGNGTRTESYRAEPCRRIAISPYRVSRCPGVLVLVQAYFYTRPVALPPLICSEYIDAFLGLHFVADIYSVVKSAPVLNISLREFLTRRNDF